jgi:glycosyltransferase involved in cell wall biosynthesis
VMRVVYNGISQQDFWREADVRKGVLEEFGFPKEGRLIVAVGRLSEPKDYPNLLRAVSQLDAAREGLYVIVAGEGMLRQALADLTAELGIADRVRFVGVRRDVRRLLSACDVFVLSSAWEGFPMAVGEAMSCECTVVATDCGGVKEFLGSTGILVPPRNSAALAAGIQRALSLSTGERRDMGAAARARVSEFFSLSASAESWLRIYKDGLEVSRC